MRIGFEGWPLLVACLVAGCASGPATTAPQETIRLENGSFTAELNGFRIHYEVRGEGPVLMTVPNSWGLTHQGLRALFRPLEDRLTVVYFDPRGMGQSAPIREDSDMGMSAVRADFDALRRHLGLPRVHAIGWSNGAMNLILLAAERPETIASAIFLHGVARFSEEDLKPFYDRYPGLMERYRSFQQEMETANIPPEERNARLRRFSLEIWLPYLFADREAGRRMLPGLYADAGFSWSHVRYADTESPSFDARDRLGAIRARSLVLAGAHDMMPPERAQEIHLGIPGSRFVVFEHSAHFAPVEEPEAFVATVLDFLGPGRSKGL